MVESSRIKGLFNAWAVKVLKGYTRAIGNLYHVRDVDRGYRLEMDRRYIKQVLEAKSNMPRSLKANMSRNDCKKVKNDWEKLGYNITNNSREALLLDKRNGNTLWDDAIAKHIMALERLGLLQLHPP